MNKNLIYFLAFILITVAVSTIAYSKYTLRNEEGLVYVSIFEPKSKIIEFENFITLSKPSICSSSESYFKGLPIEAVDDFKKANKEGAAPIRLTALELNVPIVSWEDTKSMHESGTTFAFRPKNKSLLYLSRVGFNKKRTNAILCIEVSKNSYGKGVLFFLEKKDNKWKVSNNLTIWIS